MITLRLRVSSIHHTLHSLWLSSNPLTVYNLHPVHHPLCSHFFTLHYPLLPAAANRIVFYPLHKIIYYQRVFTPPPPYRIISYQQFPCRGIFAFNSCSTSHPLLKRSFTVISITSNLDLWGINFSSCKFISCKKLNFFHWVLH